MFIVHCRLNACCKTKKTCAFSTCTKRQNRNIVHLHVALVQKTEILCVCHLCTVSPCKNKVQTYTNKCITQPQHHVSVLGQATGLHPHHRPHFVWPGNGGKKPLACRIQAWHASTPMSPQASPMACRRFTLV